MANIKQQISEMFAELDAAIAMTDKVCNITDLFKEFSLSLSISEKISPFQLIFQILQRLGITYDDLVEYLTYILTSTLPTIELGIKSILLTNLKGLVSCSIDPRIPDKLRKGSQGNGISLFLSNIDYFNKFSISPLSKEGQYKYFGTTGMTVYDLVKAQDMDAFLWFVINKGKFPNVQPIASLNDFVDKYGMEKIEAGTLLTPLELQIKTKDKDHSSKILPGNVFAYTGNSSVISMCYKSYRETDDDGYSYIASNVLIPISDSNTSVNWCKNPALILGTFNPLEYVTRDADNIAKDVAICNFSYERNNEASSGENILRFTILPKPAEHIPDLTLDNESIVAYRRLRFNGYGEQDSKGMYSYSSNNFNDSNFHTGKEIVEVNGLTINNKTGKYSIENKEDNVKKLQACYPGLTVFEFNYDYVMSLKLFDAKVLAATVIDELLNLTASVNFSFSSKRTAEEEEIREIVKNIINEDDSNIDDCFYSFSNEKYDTLLRNAQEKRLQVQRFGDVIYPDTDTSSITDILDEYNDEADLVKQRKTLQRAITQASIVSSSNSNSEDQTNVQMKFLFNFIEELITVIVQSVFSPKVMVLLAVNTELMGNDAFKNIKDYKDILKTMQSLVVGIIRNIKNLLLQELLKFVLQKLKPIVEKMTSLLVQEQIDQYTSLIRQIIKSCDMSYFFALLTLFKNKDEETVLDVVDYPDIDTSTTTNDTPKTSC